MPDLLIDTDMLRQLDSSLKVILESLGSSPRMSHSTADACGDGDLAGVLIDFADDWEDTRNAMIDAVRAVSDGVHTVSSAFDTVDSELVKLLFGSEK